MAKSKAAAARRAKAASRATGEAGRRGEDVRSDLWVRVALRERGGLRLALGSKVDPYYGESIRGQVSEILDTLGVADAEVEIDDQGALPFVIAARVEAALRAAGVESAGDVRPEVSVPRNPPSLRDRLRRSRLYLPGNEPKYMPSAGLYRPDGVILDLEDSVHPDQKPAARLLVRNALRAVDFLGAERMVRVNQPPSGLDDLRAVVPEGPDVILLPKVESPDQVREADRVIGELSGDSASDRPPWLMPILESALGVENAFEIARASDRVVALTIGLEDYAADLGVPRSSDGIESAFARTRLVNAARAAGVQAIDSVYSAVDDVEGLRDWAEEARQLGFQGMGCLHPRQIEIVHRAFAPTAEQVERARAIVEAYERAKAAGLGVVSLGSKMIDPPVVKQALRIVSQADEAGRRSSGEGR